MRLAFLKTWEPLEITLAASAFLHLVVIVAVKFEPPDLKFFKDKMPPLEVVLVNTKTETAPTKADALAQANLNRGGNTEENRRLKSALPPPKQQVTEVSVKPAAEAKKAAAAAEARAEAERKQQQKVAELERQAQQLMTQIQAQKKVETAPPKQSAAPEIEKQQQPATTKLSGTELVASSLDIARLEAQIAKQQDEYQKRPKRKFIGARTQEYRFATYFEALRQKVEKVGSLNYPEAAKGQYGRLMMTISIKSDGSLEKVELNNSSGNSVLDNAAIRIIELSAPFAAFPEEIKRDTDIVSFTRYVTFTREDKVVTE